MNLLGYWAWEIKKCKPFSILELLAESFISTLGVREGGLWALKGGLQGLEGRKDGLCVDGQVPVLN